MKPSLYILIGLSLLLSCESVELPTIDTTPLVVVEGWFSDQQDFQYVRLTYSTRLESAQEIIPILGAQVNIIDSNNQTYSLSPRQGGLYQSDDRISAQFGLSYQLQVVLEDGTIINSPFLQVNDDSKIDSLTFGSYLRENPDDPSADDEVLYPIVAASDRPNLKNYYRWKVSRNDTLFNRLSDMTLLSDQFFDGNKFTNELTAFEFQIGDKVKVEQIQISEAAFSHLSLIKLQATTLGTINATFPAEVRSNLTSTKEGENVLGFWGVVSIDSDTLTIR